MALSHHRYGLLLLAASLSVSSALSAKSLNFRGARYCEILLHKSGLEFSVYNTINLNDCPEALWKKITVEKIQEETGKKIVHLNGPRYFMFDQVKNTSLVNPRIRTLGGLQMREAGVLHLRKPLMLLKSQPYTQQEVKRHTTWVYKAAQPVYELINPNHEVFVLQSYTTQKKSTLTQTKLSKLGKMLTLPKGWKFKTGLLKTDQTVPAIDNKAIVVTDNFLNTYQKASHDLLD